MHLAGRQWWLGIIPAMILLPEYLAPILAIGLFSLACRDASLRGGSLHIGRAGKPLLLYIAWMGFGAFYSGHPLNSLSSFGMWLVALLGYLGIHAILCNRRRIEWCCWLLGLAAGICGLIALFQYIAIGTFQWDLPTCLWEPLDNAFYRNFPVALDFHVPGALRTSGTFNNPNIMAECLVMLMPFAFFSGFSGHRTRRRIIARFCLVFAICGIAVSFCRGAYLALLLMIGIFLLFLPERIPALLAAAGAALSCIPTNIIDRFLSIGSGDRSITNRLAMWQIGLQQTTTHPLLGFGAGVSNTTDMLTLAGVDAPHMHNIYIQLLIEGGLPALMLMAAIAYYYLRTPMDLLIRRRQRDLAVMLVAGAVGAAVCGMFDFLFMTPKLVCVFLLIIGVADSIYQIELAPSDNLPPIKGFATPGTLLFAN